MRKRLKPIPSRCGWLRCGPAVLMAVTSCTKRQAEESILRQRRDGRRRIVGVTRTELITALRSFTLNPFAQYPNGAYTILLNEWLAVRPTQDICIVELSDHYIAVAGDRFVDNLHRGNKTWPLAECDWLECLVHTVIWITPN